MVEITNNFKVSDKLDSDNELEFFCLNSSQTSSVNIWLKEDEIIKLRNHLNTIIDGIK